MEDVMNTIEKAPVKQVSSQFPGSIITLLIGSNVAISLQLESGLPEAVIEVRNRSGKLKGTLILDIEKLMELDLVPSPMDFDC
jgi:hypothetical protein